MQYTKGSLLAKWQHVLVRATLLKIEYFILSYFSHPIASLYTGVVGQSLCVTTDQWYTISFKWTLCFTIHFWPVSSQSAPLTHMLPWCLHSFGATVPKGSYRKHPQKEGWLQRFCCSMQNNWYGFSSHHLASSISSPILLCFKLYSCVRD